MHINVDPSQVPPSITISDADDFTKFDVVLTVPAHAWVDPASLPALAGRQADPEWRSKLDDMLRYAGGKGWLDDAGRVRAHVETATAPGPSS